MAFLRTKNFTGQRLPLNPYSTTPEVTIDGAADPSWNDCEVIGGLAECQVYVTNVRNLRLNGLEVTHPAGIGVYVEQTGSTDLEIVNCYVHDCGKDGFFVNQGPSTSAPRHVNLRLNNNRVYNVGKGVTGDTVLRNGITCYASDVIVQGNDINNVPKGDGIKGYSNGFYAANRIRNTGRAGMSFQPEIPPGSQKLRITGNNIALMGLDAAAANSPGVGIYSTGTTKTIPAGIEIDLNTITALPKPHIFVQGPYTASVHDNTLDGEAPPVNPPNPPPPPTVNEPSTGVVGEPLSRPSTILLVTADGPPGSALLLDADAQLRGKPITMQGGARLVPYGEAGRYAFRLTGDLECFVECEHVDMAWGTFDGAVEVIYRPDAVTAGATVFDFRDDNGSFGFAMGIDADLNFYSEATDTGFGGAHAGLGRVQYLALSRAGGTARAYSALTTAGTAPLLFSTAAALNCTNGRIRLGAGIRGLILGFRVSKRTGRGMSASEIGIVRNFPVL